MPAVIAEAKETYGLSLFSKYARDNFGCYFASDSSHKDVDQIAFHGLNHCREISDLLKTKVGSQVPLKQVADSKDNNHHFLVFYQPEAHDKNSPLDPVIIDPTYKQFFSFSAMDGILNYALYRGKSELKQIFQEYRHSYKVDPNRINEMQLALTLIEPVFVGTHSEFLKILNEFGEIRGETYNFPKAINDEIQKHLLTFAGKPHSWVEVEAVANGVGETNFRLKEETLFPGKIVDPNSSLEKPKIVIPDPSNQNLR